MDKTYLFSVGPSTPATVCIAPGEEVELIVEGAFIDVKDINDVPTPFTPESDGHPLAPIAGPIEVAGAAPGDSVIVELLDLQPEGVGVNAIMKNFGVLHEEFGEPALIACPVRDGKAWFGDRVPIPLYPNLGTVSTMPPDGYKPSYAGKYGGDFDQRDVGVGARIHLPVMVPGALVFFADPHAVISDGIISGTGVECSTRLHARIDLVKDSPIDRPILDRGDTVQILGFGETMETATADASRAAVAFVAGHTTLTPQESYMLLGIVGDLRIGTSPRPIMAARLIISKEVLRAAGWDGSVIGAAAG